MMASRTRTLVPDERQMILPLSPVRNRDFLSNHWIEHRLPIEPEWQEYQEAANGILKQLLSLWSVESSRVALYGDEAGLEEKFIQPVFERLEHGASSPRVGATNNDHSGRRPARSVSRSACHRQAGTSLGQT